MISQKEYEIAVTELQKYLDAPQPPAVGSADAKRFEEILDAVEAYEACLAERFEEKT